MNILNETSKMKTGGLKNEGLQEVLIELVLRNSLMGVQSRLLFPDAI